MIQGFHRSAFFWKVPYYEPSLDCYVFEKHFVIPWFCGLRLPIFRKNWWIYFFKLGHFDCLDTVSRDQIFYLLPWNKTKEKYKWISIMCDGGFNSLKELRQFWQDFENSFNIEGVELF